MDDGIEPITPATTTAPCAGERQVADASLGLSHNLGGVPYLGIAAISILGLHG